MRQIEAAREHIARVGVAVPGIAVAVRPAGVLAIAMVGALTCLVTVIITVAVVTFLYP
ncbi:MAG TPA: hypothetical protein VI485_05825 [Vicinamibacterales bacterium]|nr:hypothetical protein [Vicinamibacterales bacterium]